MRFLGLFRGSRVRETARTLYITVVEQARRPGFYRDCGVPDTVDGRFDMIAMHAFLLLRRLRRDHGQTADLAQALFDLMFADMDQNLREMGVGDLGVGRRIKTMAKAFYGRLGAYEAGLAGDDQALADALRRNLFRKTNPQEGDVAALARYMRREAAALDALGLDRLMAGEVRFGPAPGGTRGVSPRQRGAGNAPAAPGGTRGVPPRQRGAGDAPAAPGSRQGEEKA